ncbi:FAD synthetase [Rossellomorea sp. BNER]|uniref:FAD synthetase n=1 Tax=Rossellomorea sp. BNER TaxID=2962031 RepID=UPI003AF2370A|nr:FAD synthetase family protein [Rossellomorea sp. BNER]
MRLILHHEQSFELSHSIVAIGAFDGVHKGHQYVISQAVKKSQSIGVPSVVFTFDPPPRHYFQGAKMLTTIAEKLNRIKKLGVDHVIVAKFNDDFLLRTSEQFIKDLKKYNPVEIHVGKDFRFGLNRKGDVDLLNKFFSVRTARPVCCDKGTIISSTRIRKLVEQGKNNEANKLLGLHFSFQRLTLNTPSR